MPTSPNPRIIALREQYSAQHELLTAYTPGHSNAKPVPAERECILGASPTLAMADIAFGKGTAVLLVAAQLYSLNEYTNATVKMTGQQARECAENIVADPFYIDIKADELAWFFAKLKAGHYGHLYNAVDTLHVTAALHEFKSELITKRRRYFEQSESEQREAERREHDRTYLRPAEARAWLEQYRARHNGNNQ